VFSASQSPSWSPDGRYLAYAQSTTGIVSIFTLATKATRTLWTGLPGAIMALTWFPDQSALAAQGPGPDATTSSIGLRRVDLRSGALSDIVVGSGWRQFGANASFSDDGTLITYKTYEAGQVTKLVRQHIDTGAQEVLLERKPPHYIGAFAVLRGTGQIAVAFQETDGGSSLGVFDPSTRSLRPVHDTAPGDYIPAGIDVAWMPDGKSLLFVTAPGRTKGTPMSLWRVPISGGQAEKLFEAETILQVRVHPDGSLVALDTRSYRMETRAADRLFQARSR
jgi:Tol biopolymer transport system component